MKITTKSVPYTAEGKIYQSSAKGKHLLGVEIRVKAPSQIVAMLDEVGKGRHYIPSAELTEISGRDPLLDVPSRARSWKRRGFELLEAIQDDLDDEIVMLVTLAQWHAIGTLCGKLNITPGQWYLARAACNASIMEEEIDRMLESIPAA